VKPAKCPFYPDSCTVEFHPSMQHVWRNKVMRDWAKELHAVAIAPGPTVRQVMVAAARHSERTNKAALPDSPPTKTGVTNAPKITNKASERAQAWNKANRKQYNARQKLLMAGKRAKRGG
jgi:hypothetical protein